MTTDSRTHVATAGRVTPDHHGRSLADAAHASVRAMIVDRTLLAGSTVTEAALVRELGMSRTPVREALARLATEGLLRPAQGRGYVVAELTAQDLVDVYAVRARLEALAAGEAVKRLRRVDLARLEDLYDDMSAALAADDDARLAELNSQFHRTIAQVSANGYLQGMLDDIRRTFDLYRPRALTSPGRREEAHAEHGEMIEALRAGDAALAERLTRQHVERALSTRQSALNLEES